MKKLIIGVVTSIFLVMGCAAAFAKDTAVDKFINLCNKGTVEDFNRIIGKVGVNTVW